MNNFRLRMAGEVGIQPAYIKGLEQHGLCYFTWHDSGAVGAQCACCNTIVWVDPRSHALLNEHKPDGVPKSGEGYRKYYVDKLGRFLKSLPVCPSCGSSSYDKFINNVSFPRFSDGTLFDDSEGGVDIVNEDQNSVEIWWLES